MPNYRWTKVTEHAAFAPRDGAGALVFRDRMWMIGGWNPDDKVNFPKVCNSEVWSSTDGADWKLEIKQAPWEGRHCAGYTVHNDRMWVVGGDGNQGHYQNDVWSTADGIHWDLVCEKVPWGQRMLHYCFSFAGKLWVMGGQTLPQFAPEKEIFYSDVWSSPDGANWRRETDMVPWAPRGMSGGSIVFQNRMWILGGGTYDTPGKPVREFHNDAWSTADGVHWTRHTPAAQWHPRQYHDVAVFDGRMWVMEGYHIDSGNRNDVWHSADGVNWTEVPNTPWLPRHAGGAYVYKNALWMVAGNNMTPDAWKLTRVD